AGASGWGGGVVLAGRLGARRNGSAAGPAQRVPDRGRRVPPPGPFGRRLVRVAARREHLLRPRDRGGARLPGGARAAAAGRLAAAGGAARLSRTPAGDARALLRPAVPLQTDPAALVRRGPAPASRPQRARHHPP